ncbi:hypothetical protein [Nodosilinea sp. E11]|uniref:hypothetical protein n=1 Tax=Nodosilinea sp. E11 TaxID=3037479 RepID=UPI00293492D1|nr:hypothetical protein [Nodosilinea sp. E11]WOD38158.1 hypothetical protein RRF56_18255 [Nodosilinea sp. E11]
MNAPVDRAKAPVTVFADRTTESATDVHARANMASVGRETTPAADEKICLIEAHRSAYLPNQQVELLHLQAEAEALLLQLQAMHQRRQG